MGMERHSQTGAKTARKWSGLKAITNDRSARGISAPITWKELGQGIRVEDLRLDNVPARVQKRGDLWAGLLDPKKRAWLESLYHAAD